MEVGSVGITRWASSVAYNNNMLNARNATNNRKLQAHFSLSDANLYMDALFSLLIMWEDGRGKRKTNKKHRDKGGRDDKSLMSRKDLFCFLKPQATKKCFTATFKKYDFENNIN